MLPLLVYNAVLFFPQTKLKSLSYENRVELYYEIQLGLLSFIINDIVSRNNIIIITTIFVNIFVFIKMLF